MEVKQCFVGDESRRETKKVELHVSTFLFGNEIDFYSFAKITAFAAEVRADTFFSVNVVPLLF